jgi:hypothetical protein
MLTYDPNVDTMSSPIPESAPTLNEEIAREALKRIPEEAAKGVPQGLLRVVAPEKNIDESQMADFSTPIEELMQNEAVGAAYAPQQPQAPSASRMNGPAKERTASSNPFGLSNEQFQAALAGAAAVVAFSKPVQSRLQTMIPNFLGESGDPSLTGLVVTALVAAIVFYILKKFISERA